MKRILTMVFAAMALMTMWGQTNLALNQPSIATSATAGRPASAGNDGDNGTRWESASADPQQWQVDLGEAQDFNTISICWEGAYGKTFEILGGNSVGDDGFITDGVVLTSIEGQTLSGFPYVQRLTLPQTANYRYVQFKGIERGTGWGYSFFEFGVYNIVGDPVLTTLKLTASGTQVEIGQSLNLTLAASDELGAPYTVDNVQYVLSNPSVGTVVNGVFTGTVVGETTIKAVSGNVESNAVTVNVVGGQKIDLFTDWQYRVYNLGLATDGSKVGAFDANPGSVWDFLNGKTTAADEASRTYDVGFIADLRGIYDLSSIAIHFEGACSEEFTLAFAGEDGVFGETVLTGGTHVADVNNHTETFDCSAFTDVRYVKFLSTKAATIYGVKIFDFSVIGTLVNAVSDDVAPVIASATADADAATETSVTLNINASDNSSKFFAYIINNNAATIYTSGEGQNIVIGNLESGTEYTFSVVAIDAFNNRSEAMTVTAKTAGQGIVGEKIDLFTDWQYRIYNLGLATSGSKDGAFDQQTTDSPWDLLGKTTANDEASRTYDVGFIADLRGIYDLSRIAINFEGACSQEFTLAFAGEDGVFGETVLNGGTGVAGTNGHTETFDCSAFTGVRYVKFLSTKAATQWGVKIFDFTVIGALVNAVNDTEAPVIVSAEADADAATRTSVTLNLNTTDNSSKYIAYSINDEIYALGTSKTGIPATIVFDGLNSATEYPFTIFAIDAFNNRSETVTVTASTVDDSNSQKIDLFTDCEYRVYNLGLATSTSKVGAFDDNDASLWDMYKETGTDEASRTYDVGFIADLRGIYNLSEISIHFEGACSENFTLAFAGEDGVFGETVLEGGATGTNNHTETFECSTFKNVRYVKFLSTKAATQWSVKIYDFSVIGTLVSAVSDTEAPVITSAEADADAATETSVTLNINASDNSSKYVAYSINNVIYALGTSVAGTNAPIVINDLNGGTSYEFTVIAIDAFNNRSEAVTVTAQTTGEVFILTAAPAPTQAAENVVSIYSDTYTPATTISIGDWSQATQAAEETIDDNAMYLFTNFNYLGFEYTTDVDLAGMEYLHVDVLPMQPMNLGVTPIMRAGAGATEQSTLVGDLTPRQWNSIDLPLSAFTNIDFNAGVKSFQFKFDRGTASEKLYIDNLYFWKNASTEPVLGDVTGDGKVDVSDVNAVINMMLGKATMDPNADLNNDGKVDVSDVNAIINIMLGKTIN